MGEAVGGFRWRHASSLHGDTRNYGRRRINYHCSYSGVASETDVEED